MKSLEKKFLNKILKGEKLSELYFNNINENKFKNLFYKKLMKNNNKKNTIKGFSKTTQLKLKTPKIYFEHDEFIIYDNKESKIFCNYLPDYFKKDYINQKNLYKFEDDFEIFYFIDLSINTISEILLDYYKIKPISKYGNLNYKNFSYDNFLMSKE